MDKNKIELYVRRVELLQERIKKLIMHDTRPFEAVFSWSKDPVPFEKRLNGAFKPITEGEKWGETWESAWFHLKAVVPDEWAGKSVVARLNFGGEGLVLSSDGTIMQGLSNKSVFWDDFTRDEVRLFNAAKGGEAVELWVETAANGLFGVERPNDPAPDDPGKYGHLTSKVKHMKLCIKDEKLARLYLDIDVLLGIFKAQPEGSVKRARVLRVLCEAADAFETNPGNVSPAKTLLENELKKPAAASDLAVTAVGHAHIDTAWLWPMRESIRKCARTFSNQLDLIERYPDYVFGASMPQHYAFVKLHYPEIYARIKEAVKKGRWELQGGMWVEADANLISGESMIRQILHGKNFFMDEFGVDVTNLWLPDVFGYSAALPQILIKSGIHSFLTQKISWNQFNKFPHHTFSWQGIDGTEILTHFPPEDTYNSNLDAKAVAGARNRFIEHDVLDEFICLFGMGNGGGGPTEEQIERGLRMKDTEGVPRLKFESAAKFFDRLHAKKDKLEKWVGELYLELHRGTLTSHGLVKRCNRELEQQLQLIEFLYACLPLEMYPAEKLDAIWKTVLLNQFHDIIPGSSINAVYKVTHAEYKTALADCDDLVTSAAPLLFEKHADSIVLFNCLSYPFRGAVTLPAGWEGAEDGKGNVLASQKEGDAVTVFIETKPLQFVTIKRVSAENDAAAVETVQALVLENDLIKYELNEDGQVTGIFDKEEGRDVLAPNENGNVLSLYNDRPNAWDAWDIDIFYETQLLETARGLAHSSIADGPVRKGISFNLQIGNSKIKQEIYLTARSKRLDCRTTVDWQEKHRMLRVSFPVAIRSDKATYDIQYGFVERPTHRNTSWDMARFEVVGHKYADISDYDYGVALLNNCKYGYKVQGNTLDLNLLRAPTNPDPDADQGIHIFTYSLLPHCGDLRRSNVISEAHQLNQKLAVFECYSALQAQLPCSISGNGLSLEVLKKAEKDDALVIRVVEKLGRKSSGKLHLGAMVTAISKTNLVEWDDEKLVSVDGEYALALEPFEICTFKLALNRQA